MSGAPGDFRVICDRSGRKVWASETVLQWNGLRVLRRFSDQQHPQEFASAVRESASVRDPRPEAADNFLSAPVLPGDL